ncbi:MAG: GNAT family N-acetyltransferase [Candidatus Thermoplasmatota archaeon]|nr:GNAT family N-acetyltransferase [Candidatus Thermoplasmatota archaeon]
MAGKVAPNRGSTARFPVLKTRRLVLRQVSVKDAPWYFEHFNTKEIVEGQDRGGPRDLSEARAELKLYFVDVFRLKHGIRWGITVKGDDKLIGSAGFYKWIQPERYQAEIGYDLNPAFWGKGIMTEALGVIIQYGFDHMGLHRIEVLTSHHNKRSQKLIRRLGFKREGVLRDHYFIEGRFSDDVLFSLLKEEWEGARKRSPRHQG